MLTGLEITGGTNRKGMPEAIQRLFLSPGESLAVVGPTGSGKSELLSDIEQLAEYDTPSGRAVRLLQKNGEPLRPQRASAVVATLSQRTNFIMDMSVSDFAAMHAASLGKSGRDWAAETVRLANTLCGEPMSEDSLLQRLSGGQTRALMIADIALISDAPVVLIDEVENAGIDKHKAVDVLSGHGKITVIATHDPILMLASPSRLVMGEGGMRERIAVDENEAQCRRKLALLDETLLQARELLRQGRRLEEELFA